MRFPFISVGSPFPWNVFTDFTYIWWEKSIKGYLIFYFNCFILDRANFLPRIPFRIELPQWRREEKKINKQWNNGSFQVLWTVFYYNGWGTQDAHAPKHIESISTFFLPPVSIYRILLVSQLAKQTKMDCSHSRLRSSEWTFDGTQNEI